MEATPKLQDYAAIGDGRSAALISRSGSLDWLCWPRFDSFPLRTTARPAAGGTWSITPSGPAQSERSYIDRTNALRTRFQTTTGTIYPDRLHAGRGRGGQAAAALART